MQSNWQQKLSKINQIITYAVLVVTYTKTPKGSSMSRERKDCQKGNPIMTEAGAFQKIGH